MVAVVVAAALAVLASCTKRPPPAPVTSDDCAHLVDRYAELITPDASARAQIRDRAKTELEACTRDVSRAGYDCAMRASDPDTFEGCLKR